MLRVVILAGLLVGTTGCAKDDVDAARKKMQEDRRATPGGHGTDAPMGGSPSVGSSGPTDGAEIPLKTTGLGSAAELQRELAKLQDPRAAEQFERAFRLTFTSDASKRDYHEAERLLRP